MFGYEINIWIFTAVAVFSSGVYWIVVQRLYTPMQKLFWTSGCGGTWCLAGLGASYEKTPLWVSDYRGASLEYLWFYSAFLIALAVGFCLALRMTRRLSEHAGGVPAHALEAITQNPRCVYWTLGAFAFLVLFPLLYPKLRLDMLLTPPRPDITFFTGLHLEKGLLQQLVEYVRLLSFPFYLMVLYAFRRRYGQLIVLIAFPIYVDLCATGYVGRGAIAMGVLLFVLAAWLDNPAIRWRLGLFVTLGLPFCLFAFFVLGFLRADNDWRNVTNNPVHAVGRLVLGQTSFPALSWVVLESNAQADVKDYMTWLVTTPVPKVLTGRLSETRVNYDITYLIRRLQPGDRGFTVDLTGIVTESIYIYGRRLFWCHALFIGALFGFLCSLIERIPCALFIGVYFAVMWGYVINRAGIASGWPVLSNSFLLFYTLILYLLVDTGMSGVVERRQIETQPPAVAGRTYGKGSRPWQ